MSDLKEVVAEAKAAAEANIAADNARLKEVIVENVIEFPEGLPRESYDEPINEAPGDKPDVLGLRAEFVYAIADQAKVSRGKVRRVLNAFAPAFAARVQEAMIDGYNTGIEATINEYERQAALEHSDDPTGSEGREEGVSTEA